MALDEVLQPTEFENLHFVSAGAPVSNPSELLAQAGFTQFLAELLRRFDRVVIDSAPMLGISDTLLLSSRVQAVCFVIRANQTPRRGVLRAVEVLKRSEAPLIGVLLNGLTPRRSDPYGENYYYYYRSGQKGKK
jgi:Mrp family chromosome partitioning ATPase